MSLARLPLVARIAAVALLVVAAVVIVVVATSGKSEAPTEEAAALCNNGWKHYADPDGRFSFCYPPEMTLDIGEGEPYAVSVIVTTDGRAPSEANVIAFSVFWKASSRFLAGEISSRCILQEQHFGAPIREERRTIAGRAVIVCRADGPTATHGVSPFEVEVPISGSDGWLQIGALLGPDPAKSEPTINRILASLQVPAQR